jgi:hypothetical protein
LPCRDGFGVSSHARAFSHVVAVLTSTICSKQHPRPAGT